MNTVLWLLFLSMTINYIDRGALSVSAPVLSKELGLTADRMGWLFSAFFWSYSLFQLISGWLADRYDVKRVYAAGFTIWSAATMAMGLLPRFEALAGARLLLGIGESVAYPACSRVIVQNFPENRRGFANALVDAGTKIGPGLSTLFGGLLVSAFGWRALFIGLGAVSLLWLIPWILLVPRGASDGEKGPRQPSIGYGELLRNRQLWVTSAGMFCLGYVWYFLLSWLPSYLVSERGFSIQAMAVSGSAPFFVMAAATVLGGWLSDRWIRRGGDVSRVRRTFAVCGLAGCGAAMAPAVLTKDPAAAIGLICAACFCLGVYTSNVWAITQTLAGSHAAAKWTAFQNFVGNLGGVVSPALTGWIVARTGSFLYAFFGAVAVVAAGALCYAILLGEIRSVRWKGGER